MKTEYKVYTSFGGRLLATANDLQEVRSIAISESIHQPVDVWTATGGMFGMGQPLEHYMDGLSTH